MTAKEGQIMPVLKILVVDDHPIFQKGLLGSLKADFPEATIASAMSAREAMQLFSEAKWNLVILDLSLPDKSGLEVLQEMKKAHPETPILVLTLYAEDRFAVRAFRAGVDGYLTKQSSPGDLNAAIRKVLSGGKYVTASLAEKFALQINKDLANAPHELLSDREYQVMGFLAHGRSIGSIAEELHLSVNTISTYRARILEKLNLATTAEIITYAIHNKLID